tara:strand:- start:2993 stop:3526 length:534 start_codon:yes stop_codon:yes gene_type:complete
MYDIIYADPPWSYGTTKNNVPSRSKKGQPYKSMRMIDIYDFEIPETNKDAVLFLWATSPLIPEALYCMKRWGFEYKNIAFTWIKKNKKSGSNFWGMGSWTRSNPEYCLLGTKGNPKKNSSSVHSVIESVIEEHSKKPDIIRDKIVELCGSDKKKIELFSRKTIEGWDCIGNETTKFN